MRLTLSPVRMDATLTAAALGDVLTLNGVAWDLATYAGGCDWIAGPPVLGPDGWAVTLILPHGPDAPEATRMPAPILVTGDGPIPLPE